MNEASRMAVGRPARRLPLLPAMSLRTRIFLAMLAGALVIFIASGAALMNRITDDFDQRIAMESVSAGRLAAQYYNQEATQLAATARLVAAMPSVRSALEANQPTGLAQIQDRLQNASDLNNNADSYVVYDRAGRNVYDAYVPGAATSAPPLLHQLLTTRAASSQGVELMNGKPVLIGGAPVYGDNGLLGVVGIVEPIGPELLSETEQQTGYPCAVFDAAGHQLARSPHFNVWPTVPPARPARTNATPAPSEAGKTGQRVTIPNQAADVYLLPLFDSRGDLAGTLALYQQTSAVRQVQWNVQSLFMAFILAGLLVSATVAWLFSRALVRPIRQLASAAEEIASGEYDHPIPRSGPDEIGQLTSTFERMRKRVSETTRALVAEKRRSEAEAVLVNSVLNSTNDGIIMLDADGRFRVANRRWEALFGIPAIELESLTAEELRAALAAGMADQEAFDAASVALLRDPERTVYDEVFTQRWPEQRQLRRFSAPVRSQEGEIIGRVHVFSDITKERQADELKQALLSTVSHELRTPLTAIKGYARTLMLGDWDDETSRDFLHIVDEEADRLSELVDNLLDLSKLEAGVLQIHRQPVLLCALIPRVIQRHRNDSPDHELVGVCDDDLPLIEGDARRLEQVLDNLIGNATKYSERGVVTVAARRDEAGVEVTVSDQGPGIPDALVERVFERFFRVDPSQTGGTGLGLSICRGLIEAHGGRIWIKETSAAGTTVVFTLPALPGGHALPAPSRAATSVA